MEQALFHPIFLFLERIMHGYCRRDFKKLKIQIQKPSLPDIPESRRYIFMRRNPGKKNEQEVIFYTNILVVEGPKDFLGNGLSELKQEIENYIKKHPEGAKRNSYRE